MIDLHPTFPVPVDDPFPDLTERFREAGAFERDAVTGRRTDDAITAMRGTIQSVVSGLQSDAKTFRAVFGKIASARTEMAKRVVHIGTRAMDDPTVTDGRLAAILVGLAIHEVAHINFDRDTAVTFARTAAGHRLGALAGDIHNIAQDVRIEYKQRLALPGYAECLDVAMHFLDGQPRRDSVTDHGLSTSGARNLYFAAVRAPWTISDWTGAPAAREWGDEWARRFERTDSPSKIVSTLMEALDHMETWLATDEETPPPPPPPPSPPAEPEDEPTPPPPPKGDPDDGDPDEGGASTATDDGDDEPTEGEDPGEPDDEDLDDEDLDDEDDEDLDEDDTEGDDTDGDDEPDDTEGEPADDGDATEGDDEGEGFTEGEQPMDLDSSDEWGDDLSDMVLDEPTVSPEASDDATGKDAAKGLEDLDFASCSSVAAEGSNDAAYAAIVARVERSREEGFMRTISTPGWPDRRVRRVREWDGRSNIKS